MARLTIALFTIIVMLMPVVSPANTATDVLTKESLVNNEWGPNIGELGLYFHFTTDNTFRTDANFEGGAGYSGTYEIADRKLVLNIIKAGEGKELIGKELIYQLASDNNAIYFTKYLALENGENYKGRMLWKLWNHKAIVKNGQKRTFQGEKVVTINDLATIKENTTYYQFPQKTSKRFMFSILDDNSMKSSDWSYTVPSEILKRPYLDGKIKLLLRTTEKDQKNGFWYCIVLPVGTGGYDGLRIEKSDKFWNGANIGWIKETDIMKINSRK